MIYSVLAVVAVACKNETEAGPEADTDYYPLAVKTYRIYDVVDSTFTENKGTAVRYQFRDSVAESYTDAAGLVAYRVVRGRRSATAPGKWLNDSVVVVNPGEQTLLLTRNNRRTVELVFPVRDGRVWNMNAYNSKDTIVAENRRYEQVAMAFKTTANGKTTTYDNTVTTTSDDKNALYVTLGHQVYAKGVGLVYRVARQHNFGCPPGSPASCSFVTGYIKNGHSRTETLIESGRY